MPLRREFYVYDSAPGKAGLSDIVLRFDENSDVINRYLHGPGIDQVFSDENFLNEILWGLGDKQGSIENWIEYDKSTDVTSVVATVSYDAFGVITSQTPGFDVFYAYTGRIWDGVTEQYDFRTRVYDASAGRFLSEDWIGFGGGQANLAVYVGNSPTNYTDPGGMDAAIVGDANNTHSYFIFDIPPAEGDSRPTIRVRVDFYGAGANWDNTEQAISGCPGTILFKAWPLYGPKEANPIAIPEGKPGLLLEGGREEGLLTLGWLSLVMEDNVWKVLEESLAGYEPHDTETPEQSAFPVKTRGKGEFEIYQVTPPITVCTTFAHKAAVAYNGGDNPYNYLPTWPSTLGTKDIDNSTSYSDTIPFGFYSY